MLGAVLQVLAAYVLVDLATGLYHLMTDRGWNLRQQVQLFRLHHETNTMDGFDWQPMAIGLPALLLGLWLQSSFLIAAGSFWILAQVPHYYAHRRSRSKAIHRVVRWLQRTGMILSPEHHAAHHRGQFDRNFCIFAGWHDRWLNRLVARRTSSPKAP